MLENACPPFGGTSYSERPDRIPVYSRGMERSPEEFPSIHAGYRTRIHRYLARLVGQGDAEDLTQEVFVRVSRGLPDFKGAAKLSTWIYRIATNVAVDRLRDRKSVV